MSEHVHMYAYGLCRCGLIADVTKCSHTARIIQETSYSGYIQWCQQCGTKVSDRAIDQRDIDIWAHNRAALGLEHE